MEYSEALIAQLNSLKSYFRKVKEWNWGFILGVISSVIFSIILIFMIYKYRDKFIGNPNSSIFLILLILTTTLIIGSIYLENKWQKICIILSYIFVIIFLGYIISLSGEDRRPILYQLLIFIAIALLVLTEWLDILGIQSIYYDKNLWAQEYLYILFQEMVYDFAHNVLVKTDIFYLFLQVYFLLEGFLFSSYLDLTRL